MEKNDSPSPTCKHQLSCGACSNLGSSYSHHLAEKQALLINTLGEYSVKSKSISPSPKSLNYRQKVQLPFGMTKVNGKKKVTIGPFISRTHDVVDQEECHTQEQYLNAMLLAIKEWVNETHIPIYDEKKDRGILRYLCLRQSKEYHEILLGFVTAKPFVDFDRFLPSLLEKINCTLKAPYKLVGIIEDQNSSKGNKVLSGNQKQLWGAKYFNEKIGSLDFKLGLNTFFQINTWQTPHLYNFILDEIPENAKVLDLFSGTGSIALWASQKAKQVTGIEINPSSVNAAKEACSQNKIINASFLCGDASVLLQETPLGAFDCTIVDPPRSGLSSSIIQCFLEQPQEKIIYTSCNPKSFLRDMKSLSSIYEVEKIQPVDMFPFTKHVELVVSLKRKAEYSI